MPELKIYVPTYLGGISPKVPGNKVRADFDEPYVPIVVRPADGLRIVLGSHDFWDAKFPDIQVERRPAGWVIFLQPIGGGDSSGFIFFTDDGRSFVVPENDLGSTPPIVHCEYDKAVAEVDGFSQK